MDKVNTLFFQNYESKDKKRGCCNVAKANLIQ